MNRVVTNTLFLMAVCQNSYGASHGSLSNQDISDNAIICMSVGLQASVTGLDDLTLTAVKEDGNAGAIYQQSDTFQLEANGGVRLLASSGPLKYQTHEINVHYLLDGTLYSIATQENQIHSAHHTLTAIAQLGNISSQLAGSYASTLYLTVVPSIGADGGCGQQIVTSPVEESEWAFVAYEDLYPNAGDADYNDFVMAFQSSESYNASGELETINMTYIPVARGAGYNHSAHLNMDGELWNSKNITTVTDEMFAGDAIIKATYTNLSNGTEIEKYYRKDQDVTLFHNTRAALDGMANVYDNGDITEPLWKTELEITLANPDLNMYEQRGEISDDSYRIYLHVDNTNSDIDLYTVNQSDGMIDENGHPFGIIVPDTWQWPLENENINDAYPHFSEYRAWLAGETNELSYEAEHWYLSPATDGSVVSEETVEEILSYGQ